MYFYTLYKPIFCAKMALGKKVCKMDKHLSCSEQTKIKLAQALKELIRTEPFEKITISDITEKCNVHRQTFYYHFQDRYELLDWLLYKELFIPLAEGFTFDNMYEKLLTMFSTMFDDKKFYQNALKINREDVTRFVGNIVTEEFLRIIKSLRKENNVSFVDSDEEMFISEFFGYGVSGVVFNWVSKGMKETPDIMIERMECLVNTCKTVIISRSSNK